MSGYLDTMEDKASAFRRKLLDSISKDARPVDFPYENEDDLREAVENFRAYLMILQEWDKRDRAKEKTTALHFAD